MLTLSQPEVAAGTYALGGPAVHLANGNVGRSFASLGLRVGAPLLLGYGLSAGCTPNETSGGAGCAVLFGAGAILGVLGAVAIDAAALAREKVPVDNTAVSVGPVKVIPSVAMSSKQASLTLGGTF